MIDIFKEIRNKIHNDMCERRAEIRKKLGQTEAMDAEDKEVEEAYPRESQAMSDFFNAMLSRIIPDLRLMEAFLAAVPEPLAKVWSRQMIFQLEGWKRGFESSEVERVKYFEHQRAKAKVNVDKIN